MHPPGLVDVVENTHHPEDWRGINPFAERLVIEADVAAGDGNLQLLAGLRNAIDSLRELPHDGWLFRITEIQAVGRAHRSGTRTRHLALGRGDSLHGAQSRIEITPASIAIELHGQTA